MNLYDLQINVLLILNTDKQLKSIGDLFNY